MSYLFEYLGWFGENQKGTKTMAMQGSGLRITFLVFWFLFLVALLFEYKNTYNEDIRNKILESIGAATSLFCPPVGAMYFTFFALCKKYKIFYEDSQKIYDGETQLLSNNY